MNNVIASGFFPCKDCDKREVGCHGWCEPYLNAVGRNEEIKKAIRYDSDINSYMCASIRKAKIKSGW